MRRLQIYVAIVRWTAPLLFVLMWLMLMTGPAAYKSLLFERLTFGLINAAVTGKLHAVWLPVLTTVLFYLHAILGFQVLGYRLKWVKRKAIWEISIFVLGLGMIVQFLWLYYG